MEKSELIGELYVLRAGLSTVSSEKDNIDGILNNARAKKQKMLGEANNAIDFAQNDIKKLQEQMMEIENKKEQNKERAGIDLGIPDSFGKAIFLTVLMLLSLAFVAYMVVFWLVDTKVLDVEESPILKFLYGWVVDLVYDIETNNKESLKPVCVIVSLVLSLGSLPLAFFGIKGCVMCWVDFVSTVHGLPTKKLARKNLRKCVADSVVAEKQYQSMQQYLSERRENLENVKRCCDAIDEDTSEETDPKIKCLQEYISALESTYCDTLDIRDWENLDYIIFCIETGRADTIKEALLLVDKQRQTDQLVQAIGHATQSVCKTINIGLGRLHDSMMKGFSLLSDQIVIQSKIIANEMGALRSEISDVNYRLNSQAQYMQSLTSEINVNNALMQKANTNSIALVNDVNQIRNHADYAMRKLQNGI